MDASGNGDKFSKELDEIAERIIEIKRQYNIHWEEYARIVEDEAAQTGFDQIVDQLINLIKCYQLLIKGEAKKAKTTAENAEKEAVKAGCNLLKPIMLELWNEADKATSPPEPTVGYLTEAIALFAEATRKKDTSIRWAEDDLYDGFTLMVEANELLKSIPEKAKQAVNSARPATKLHQKSNRVLWISIGVVLIIGLLNQEIRLLFKFLWRWISGGN